MNSFICSTLFGAMLVCFFSISVGQASVITRSDSSNYETAGSGTALEIEALLQEYLEEARELKDLIHRYVANSPPNFHKRAQFLRLGR
ncbi:unnamed protein product [Hymenolepis diminuta]|uniref:Uncharacterized protein n=2 Tax=Hymenolepis diminuta TaxID=6216 RepID=A0A564ZCX0_HYMDI|nr:unnamed protein product [Hymenolepis diminuta]